MLYNKASWDFEKCGLGLNADTTESHQANS
jgi:hypothetical protein